MPDGTPSVVVLHLDGGHLQDTIDIAADPRHHGNVGALAARRLFTVVRDMRQRLGGTGMGVLVSPLHPRGLVKG